MNQAPTIYLHN